MRGLSHVHFYVSETHRNQELVALLPHRNATDLHAAPPVYSADILRQNITLRVSLTTELADFFQPDQFNPACGLGLFVRNKTEFFI